MSDDNAPKRALTLAARNDHIEKIDQCKLAALDELRWPTRDLAANLLRVMRGAGKPHHLIDQLFALTAAIDRAGQVSNAWGIWTVLEEELQSVFPDWEKETDMESAENSIARGALQLLASNLLQQRAQSAAGSREMHEGVRELERLWEREREKARLESIRFAKTVARPRKAINKMAEKPRAEPVTGSPDPPEARPASTAEAMRRRARQLARDLK